MAKCRALAYSVHQARYLLLRYEHGWGKGRKVPSLGVSTGTLSTCALPCIRCAVLVAEVLRMHVRVATAGTCRSIHLPVE